MFRPHRVRTTVLATAVAAVTVGGISPGAYAQGRTAVLEEIIVTARRTEESIQDTPISMQAFSSRDLEQIGAFEAGAVAAFTPNVRMQKQTSSLDNYSYSIRGVSASETSLAVEPTVGLYLDGVYIARNTGAAFDIVDLERIEILRGPQGTLFGRNTIGGAINIITEKPRGDFAFKQLLSFGNYGYRRSQTTIDTPKVGDFAFKLSYMQSEQDGWMRSSINGGRLGDRESEAFRFAARWTPTDDITVDYTFDRSERQSNPSMEQLSHVRDLHVALGGDAYAQAQAIASQSRQRRIPIEVTDPRDSFSDIDGHALTVEWLATPDLTIKSITSYREWDGGVDNTNFGSIVADGATLFDLDATLASVLPPANGAPVAVQQGSNVPLFGASRRSDQKQFTQEFQFIGTAMNDNLFYNVGLYYFEEKTNESNPQQLILPTLFLFGPDRSLEAFAGDVLPQLPNSGMGTSMLVRQPHFAYGTDNKSYAAYGQFTYTIDYDLDITLGLRYTYDKRRTYLVNQFDDIGLARISDGDTWTQFNPSLTVDYRWTPDLSTYAKVATGYRAGGYNTRATTSTSFRSPVDEEEIISYEIGLKSDWLDRSLRVNAAVFYMDYTDQQVAAFEAGAGGASTQIVNAGESTTRGLEIDVLWAPLPGLRLSASYGYLDVTYDEFITTLLDPVTGTQIGTENVDIADIAATNRYAPKHSASGSIEYEFEPFRFGTLTLRLDATYVDDFTYHPQFVLYDGTDSHTLLNARATLADIPAGRDGRMRVATWVRNITNKDYREFGIDFGGLGFAVNTWNEPRAFGLDFVYEYNR